MINCLAIPSAFDYPYAWEWLGPGGLPGLQNLWRVALRAAVGSTPIHSRLRFEVEQGRPSRVIFLDFCRRLDKPVSFNLHIM
jgi:hypothetical protein